MSRQQFDIIEQQAKARQLAERTVLEAERFKASIAAPSGKECLTPTHTDVIAVPPVDLSFNDDTAVNHCQVTNHVDTPTTHKIGKGGFVELPKLRPPRDLNPSDHQKHLELTSKDGRSFWLPFNEKEVNKINNIKQWEQAFKVYAAIYTKFNPLRGAEIYQYVHSINLAASSYIWENVAYYDYHFRKMMADNPQRSWAKTNTQLWSLSMRDPLPTRGVHNSSHGQNPNNRNVAQGGKKEWKDLGLLEVQQK